MKKNFIKFFLFTCILLTSIGSSLFANYNIESSCYGTFKHISKLSHTTQNIANHKAVIKNILGSSKKDLDLDAIEIEEEEESKHSSINKTIDKNYITASFYLLSLLFLFNYLKNSPLLQRLFTFLSTINRRFVLYQVFRI